MGLIKAAAGAFGGTMADQWKEFFYCDAIDKDVLVVKGEKRVGGRSSNKKGSDNIISSGSGIAVADGQCMIIVEQGKVVEVCAEPGQFTYDASTEPSIFAGSLGEGIHRTFDTVKKRFTFGGDTGKDQRVYYFNTKELVDNKFGTANPIPFRVVDRNIGLDIDVSVRCNGVYSYKIVDPLLFYTNVCGNVEQQYDREEIEVQLKTEFVSALQPAFAKISELQIRPSAIPGHVLELCDAMNEALTKKWQQTRGLAVVSIAMNPVTLPEEDAQLIKDAQKNYPARGHRRDRRRDFRRERQRRVLLHAARRQELYFRGKDPPRGFRAYPRHRRGRFRRRPGRGRNPCRADARTQTRLSAQRRRLHFARPAFHGAGDGRPPGR